MRDYAPIPNTGNKDEAKPKKKFGKFSLPHYPVMS